jgi:cysteine desulfurase
MKKIYLDNAATTSVAPEVLEAMKPYFSQKYGNASSLHTMGQDAKQGLEDSRERVASLLGVDSSEIYFTSCATESNNLALKGVAFANRKKGRHIITTRIEHHCVLHTAQWLERNGFDVTYLPVDKSGLVNPEDLESAIRKDTVLASVMYANNEIGTIEPIEELAKICSENDIYFHTDAVQAFGKIPVDMKGIDMLSISAHKLYGPKGVGALFVRKGVKIEPLLHGGGHERGVRSGTENIAGIVGLAAAAELTFKEMESETERQTKLREKLIKNTLKIPQTVLNGHPVRRLPNNANFSFEFIEGESIVLRLDEKGIEASTGSACSSPKLEPSHVLLAIGLEPALAHGSLRLTLGRNTTESDIDYVNNVLPEVVGDLRKLSPFGRK